MKLKRPDIYGGFRPYIVLALVLLILYFAISPFVNLNGSSGNTNTASFSDSRFNRGNAGGTSSGIQTQSGNSGGNIKGKSSGTQALPGKFDGNMKGASSGPEHSSQKSWGVDSSFAGTRQFGFGGFGEASGANLTARAVMIAGVILILGLLAALYYKRRLTPKKAGFAILAAGILMRFGYMLYTSYSVRGHDVGNLNGDGHLAYIYNLYKNFSLPVSGSGQFYHPPLSYIFEAITARFYALVTQCTDTQTILEAARLVPCFASCALLIVLYRLFDEIKLDNTAKLTALGVIALCPTFFILSASINNDMLMIFFFMTAFLYTVRWYNNPNFKNIILIAVSSGCAMMTKFSGGLIVAFSGIVFLIVLIKAIKTKAFAPRLIGQFAAYAAVFFPLGLWYSVRNFILFQQPIGYVLQIGKNSSLYIGAHSFFDRFVSFPLGSLFNSLYCNPYGDYRIWIYTLKCSVFGEFSFSDSHNVMAAMLIIINLITILLSLAAMIYVLVRRKSSPITRWGFFSIWALLVVSFICFNIKYPYGCTMDFRYIVPTVISGAVFMGIASSEMRKYKGIVPQTQHYLCTYFTVAFCLASIIFYVM